MKNILYVIAAALILASCQQEDCADCVFEPVVPTKASRVYFHYMAMDNNLGGYADLNIEEMYRGATKATLNGGVIFVLRDVPNQNSQLIAIFWDAENKKTQMKVVKDYGENLDVSSPTTLTNVIMDVDRMVDAPSWALGFGSHGMGWIPAQAYFPAGRMFSTENTGVPLTRFLIDNGGRSYMEIDKFADAVAAALPEAKEIGGGTQERKFDFIMMDLCYMGAVEFAYELKDVARYLILSPAEVIAKGMPYDRIVDDIFAYDLRQGVEEMCAEFFDFYDNYPSVGGQYATISLVDCAQFAPFTEVMKESVKGGWAKAAAVNVDALESFDRFPEATSNRVPHITYDLGKFVEAMGGNPAFDAAMAALVPYRETTGKPLLDGYGRPVITIAESNYSGLSTYIPAAKFGELNEYYKLTAWSQAIYPQ
jgi:hypothetical protein